MKLVDFTVVKTRMYSIVQCDLNESVFVWTKLRTVFKNKTSVTVVVTHKYILLVVMHNSYTYIVNLHDALINKLELQYFPIYFTCLYVNLPQYYQYLLILTFPLSVTH